jgi:hypothetical protein
VNRRPDPSAPPRLLLSECEDLLIDVSTWNQAALEGQGRSLYRTNLSDPSFSAGVFTHDSQRVVFYRGDFDHAFKKSDDHRRDPHNKKFFCELRVGRLNLIRPLLEGRISGSACYVRHDGSRRPPSVQRIYVYPAMRYLVRLWRLTNSPHGNWKFETAYRTPLQQIEKLAASTTRIADF